ncbi:hypothetical protein AB1Y20_001448 [Prymnesium parvum]|uniref:Uncharacterized protein n=1 Tax=Prymnesium parvum TaxID=97485 RepID=A0AB34KB43_PRYPA
MENAPATRLPAPAHGTSSTRGSDLFQAALQDARAAAAEYIQVCQKGEKPERPKLRMVEAGIFGRNPRASVTAAAVGAELAGAPIASDPEPSPRSAPSTPPARGMRMARSEPMIRSSRYRKGAARESGTIGGLLACAQIDKPRRLSSREPWQGGDEHTAEVSLREELRSASPCASSTASGRACSPCSPSRRNLVLVHGRFADDVVARPPKIDALLPEIEAEPQPLISSAPKWWTPPSEVVDAASSFDSRHRLISRRAHLMMNILDRDVTSVRKASVFHAIRSETQFARFVPPLRRERAAAPPAPPPPPPPRPPPPAKAWSLEASLWAPRAASDSGGLFDSDDCLRRVIEQDWACAKHVRNIDSYIVHCMDKADEEGGTRDFGTVEEVEEVLRAHAQALLQIFDYYAATRGARACRLFVWPFSAFLALVEDASIEQKGSTFCRMNHLEQIFIAASLPLRQDPQEGAEDILLASWPHTLTRVEYLECLVRIAIAKYVLPYRVTNIAEALTRLLEQDILPNMAAEISHNPNEYRRTYCYTEAVDAVLRKNEMNLRSIFSAYSRSNSSNPAAAQHLMSFRQFLELLGTVRFFDLDFSVQDASLIFNWSRMRVVADEDDESHARETRLTFTDFLEAMVRISMSKSLPNNEDLEGLNTVDTHTFVLSLQAQGGWDEFVASHPAGWDKPLRQPIEQCLHHAISLMVSTIFTAVAPPGSVKVLTTRQVRHFRKMRLSGKS